jgi:hypothetical protein
MVPQQLLAPAPYLMKTGAPQRLFESLCERGSGSLWRTLDLKPRMFVRYGVPKYKDGHIVFAISKSGTSICSFRLSASFLQELDGNPLPTPVDALQAFWRNRLRVHRLAMERYIAGGRVDLQALTAVPPEQNEISSAPTDCDGLPRRPRS